MPTPLRLLVDPDPDADVWRHVRGEPFQQCVDYLVRAAAPNKRQRPLLRQALSGGPCFMAF